MAVICCMGLSYYHHDSIHHGPTSISSLPGSASNSSLVPTLVPEEFEKKFSYMALCFASIGMACTTLSAIAIFIGEFFSA